VTPLRALLVILAVAAAGILFVQHEADRAALVRQQQRQEQPCPAPPAGDVNPIWPAGCVPPSGP
jgi:hypothetical protein